MCIWDGSPIQPEDEIEQRWRAPSEDSEGDMPWAPNPVERPQPYLDAGPEWVEPEAGTDPLYDLLKRDLDEDGA